MKALALVFALVCSTAAMADGVPLITPAPAMPLAAMRAIQAERPDILRVIHVTLNQAAFGSNVLQVTLDGTVHTFTGSLVPDQKTGQTSHAWRGKEPVVMNKFGPNDLTNRPNDMTLSAFDRGQLLGTIRIGEDIYHIAGRNGYDVLIQDDNTYVHGVSTAPANETAASAVPLTGSKALTNILAFFCLALAASCAQAQITPTNVHIDLSPGAIAAGATATAVSDAVTAFNTSLASQGINVQYTPQINTYLPFAPNDSATIQQQYNYEQNTIAALQGRAGTDSCCSISITAPGSADPTTLSVMPTAAPKADTSNAVAAINASDWLNQLTVALGRFAGATVANSLSARDRSYQGQSNVCFHTLGGLFSDPKSGVSGAVRLLHQHRAWGVYLGLDARFVLRRLAGLCEPDDS